jgi:cathepsin E
VSIDLCLSLRIASNILFCSLGPNDLTLGTLYPDSTSVIPTVTDNLYGQEKIGQNLVAVSFEPTNQDSATNGELTFGGTDSTKYIGNITYL